MYKVIRIEQNLYFDNDINDLINFPFGVKNKTYKIKEEPVKNIFIYQKELAYPLAQQQATKN